MLPIFRSEMQVRLLGLLLLQPTREWTMHELADTTGAPVSSVHRELERAIAAGIVRREAQARPHRYASAPSPFTEPLTQLLAMSVGVESQLRDALEGLPVEAAVLHGSWVEGPVRPDSDIDLLVVGDLDLAQVRRRVRPVGRRSGRNIDVTVFGRDELRDLARRRASFVRHLLEGETTPLVGDLSTILER